MKNKSFGFLSMYAAGLALGLCACTSGADAKAQAEADQKLIGEAALAEGSGATSKARLEAFVSNNANAKLQLLLKDFDNWRKFQAIHDDAACKRIVAECTALVAEHPEVADTNQGTAMLRMPSRVCGFPPATCNTASVFDAALTAWQARSPDKKVVAVSPEHIGDAELQTGLLILYRAEAPATR